LNLVANQKKVLVEKLADKFQKKQMFFKAECCASGRIFSGALRINSGSGIICSGSGNLIPNPEGFIPDPRSCLPSHSGFDPKPRPNKKVSTLYHVM
jgi:hypothetical protein